MKKVSPKMVDDLKKVKSAFGEIKLSNVGTGKFEYPEPVKDLWDGYGLKTK